MPDRIPAILESIQAIEQERNRQHKENEQRFDGIELRMAELVGQMRVIIVLLGANVLAILSQHFH